MDSKSVNKSLRLLLLAFLVIVQYTILAIEWHSQTPIYAWAYPLVTGACMAYIILNIPDDEPTYALICKHTLCFALACYLFHCSMEASPLWDAKSLRFSLISASISLILMLMKRGQHRRNSKYRKSMEQKIEQHKQKQLQG